MPTGRTVAVTEIVDGKGRWLKNLRPDPAYIAKPDGAGPYPGVVITHHAPGFDEWTREFARRFAEHGFIAIAPNLYERFGHGTPAEARAAAHSSVRS